MRHQRARVARDCQYPETAWWRLAALAPRSETLFDPAVDYVDRPESDRDSVLPDLAVWGGICVIYGNSWRPCSAR